MLLAKKHVKFNIITNTVYKNYKKRNLGQNLENISAKKIKFKVLLKLKLFKIYYVNLSI